MSENKQQVLTRENMLFHQVDILMIFPSALIIRTMLFEILRVGEAFSKNYAHQYTIKTMLQTWNIQKLILCLFDFRFTNIPCERALARKRWKLEKGAIA